MALEYPGCRNRGYDTPMHLVANVLTTDSVPPSRRLPYWRDLVCDTFVELACETAAPGDFSGSIKSRDRDGTRFSQVKSKRHHVVRDRRRIANSAFSHFLLSVQLSGRCRLMQDGRIAHLHPGDFSLYDVTRPYELRFDDDFEQLVLQVPRHQILSRLLDPSGLVAVRVSGQRGLGRLASTLVIQTASQLDCLDTTGFAHAQSSALDLVAHALADERGIVVEQQSESRELTFHRILSFIEDHLSDPDLSCERIAAASGISERHLRKIFHAKGHSASGWLWQRRLERARQRLVDPQFRQRTITTIAFDCGFKDACHFSKAFKSRFGTTPSGFRAERAGS